jgi:hypothetical protein
MTNTARQNTSVLPAWHFDVDSDRRNSICVKGNGTLLFASSFLAYCYPKVYHARWVLDHEQGLNKLLLKSPNSVLRALAFEDDLISRKRISPKRLLGKTRKKTITMSCMYGRHCDSRKA